VQRGSISSRLIVGAVLVLAAVAVADTFRDGPAAEQAASPRETASVPQVQHPGGRRTIDRISAEWARRFASNGLDGCFHTGRELCDQLRCIRTGGVTVATCRLPTPAYRRSFEAVTVDGVVIVRYEALAMLSNREMIRLQADGGTWRVLAVGGHVGRGFFEKPG
jgi:hypothetical protein